MEPHPASTPPLLRVVVFVDAQNVYRRARGAFFNDAVAHWSCGNVDPVALADAIVAAGPGGTKARRLEEVRIYTGRPDSRKDPKANAPHMRQCKVWEDKCAEVIARPLKYPNPWPSTTGERPREKGIDVGLAVDFVAFAIDDKFDVGVIVSVDSDLAPALEFVLDRPKLNKSVETVAWYCPPHAQTRIALPRSRSVLCHEFGWPEFEAVRDKTDYTTGRLHHDAPNELHPVIAHQYPPPPPIPPQSRRR